MIRAYFKFIIVASAFKVRLPHHKLHQEAATAGCCTAQFMWMSLADAQARHCIPRTSSLQHKMVLVLHQSQGPLRETAQPTAEQLPMTSAHAQHSTWCTAPCADQGWCNPSACKQCFLIKPENLGAAACVRAQMHGICVSYTWCNAVHGSYMVTMEAPCTVSCCPRDCCQLHELPKLKSCKMEANAMRQFSNSCT